MGGWRDDRMLLSLGWQTSGGGADDSDSRLIRASLILFLLGWSGGFL